MTRRLLLVNAVFAAALVIVANLAWLTAVGTTGPWYSSDVTLPLYAISLVLSLVLAIILAAVASEWAAYLDEALRALDEKMAPLRGSRREDLGRVAASEGPIKGDMAKFLESFEVMSEVPPGESAERLVRVVVGSAPDTARARWEVVQELARQRIALREARKQVWSTVGGPMVALFIVAGAAGAMLPGIEGFAVSHYQLNTFLVLLLAYGWWMLVAWTVTTLLLLRTRPRVSIPPAPGASD